MSRFNPNRRSEIFDNNKKVRYRMFKSGKQWLVSGTATISGVVGGFFMGGTGVFADENNAKTLELNDKSILANTDSTTIPAVSDLENDDTVPESANSESETENESVSGSVSASASTSAAIASESKNDLLDSDNEYNDYSQNYSSNTNEQKNATKSADQKSATDTTSKQTDESTSGSNQTKPQNSQSNAKIESNSVNDSAVTSETGISSNLGSVSGNVSESTQASVSSSDSVEDSVSVAVKNGSMAASKSAADSLVASVSTSISKAKTVTTAATPKVRFAATGNGAQTDVPGHQSNRESGIDGGQANVFLEAIDLALRPLGGLSKLGLSTDISDILSANAVIYDSASGTINVTVSKGFLSAFGKMDGVLYYWDPKANNGAGAWTEVPGSRQAMQTTETDAVISIPFNPADAGFAEGDTVFFQAGVNTSGLVQSVADAATAE